MTDNGQQSNSANVRHRWIRLVQVIFAGAATVATLALFSAGRPDEASAAIASGSAQPSRVIAVNDDDVNNPSDGDIFTQHAQDQSTANGAGT